MKATGFSGISAVMGRDRQIRFEGDTLQVVGLTLEEATQVVSLLERMSTSTTRVAPTTGQAQTSATQTAVRRIPPTPAAEPAPEAEPEKQDSKPEPKVETKPAAKPETKPKVETKPTTKVETKPKPAAKPEPKVETKPEPEPRRQVVAPGVEETEDDGDDVDFDPETGEVRSSPEEIEQEAREEREAIQAVEAEEEKPKNGKRNGTAVAADEDIPDDVKKARHLRSVIGYLVETKGFEHADAIVAWCKANADAIPTVKRIGDKLEDRVTRALQIMSN